MHNLPSLFQIFLFNNVYLRTFSEFEIIYNIFFMYNIEGDVYDTKKGENKS